MPRARLARRRYGKSATAEASLAPSTSASGDAARTQIRIPLFSDRALASFVCQTSAADEYSIHKKEREIASMTSRLALYAAVAVTAEYSASLIVMDAISRRAGLHCMRLSR